MTASLGFLSVRRHPEHGYFGGYLITNSLARPLEFHCTLPVKPSRAQELLYGPTIEDFICGEQIAKALTTKAKIRPSLVLTDGPAVLALSLVSDLITALLHFDQSDHWPHFNIPARHSRELLQIAVEPWQISLPKESRATEDVRHLLSGLAASFDLTEPFQRIVDALLEAHPIAKAA